VSESAVPWVVGLDGVMIAVRLTPKGGRDAIDGVAQLADGQAVLKVRVRSAPTEGEANAALVKLIGRSLGIAPRAVELAAGAAARLKRLRITGDPASLVAKLGEVSGVRE
jgi:uncharacterized protein (TIGR00251 family)